MGIVYVNSKKRPNIVQKQRNGVVIEKFSIDGGRKDYREQEIDKLKEQCAEWERLNLALQAEVDILTKTLENNKNQESKKTGQITHFEVVSIDKIQTKGTQARVLCVCDIDGNIQDLSILLTVDQLIKIIRASKKAKNA